MDSSPKGSSASVCGLLAEHCELTRVDEGVFERRCDRTWWGHEALFGGYAEALVIGALTEELAEPDKSLQALTMHFLRPFVDDLFRVEVSIERRGRNMANVSARAYSAGKLAGLAVASFGTRRGVNEFLALPTLAVAPIGPGEAPAVSGISVPTHAYFDMYPRIGTFARGGGDAHVGGWVRQKHPGPIDQAYIVVVADLWIPAAYHRWETPTAAVSADITTHFRSALPREDTPPTAAVFVDLRTTGSIGGFVDEDVAIWSESGVLLAQSRQMRFVHALG